MRGCGEAGSRLGEKMKRRLLSRERVAVWPAVVARWQDSGDDDLKISERYGMTAC